jgi:hypothetical protein
VQDGSLDLAAMREAAGALVGEHDFRNFCRADVLQVRGHGTTYTIISSILYSRGGGRGIGFSRRAERAVVGQQPPQLVALWHQR